MSDPQNTRGVPGENEEADTASGGAPERADESSKAHTTDRASESRESKPRAEEQPRED
ncbi:hypothetical protein ACWGJP_12940 [Microbacterium sp. NPDC055903]